MRKLLLIPALLAITLFTVYHHDVDSKSISIPTEKTEVKEFQVPESIIIVNDEIVTAKNELNVSEAKEFKVSIEPEHNTLIENVTTLTAQVENANNALACNFFWYEDDELIGMGSPFESIFEKGEHLLTLKASDGEGNLSKTELLVTAWEYSKTERLHFNAYYGNLEYTEQEIYDHNYNLVLVDDPTFYKERSFFNERNQVTERRTTYYGYEQFNRTKLFTYDEYGYHASIKTLDHEGNTIYFISYLRDKEGNVLSMKSGENENELMEENLSMETYYYAESNETVEVHEDDKKITNKAGDITFEETNYDGLKFIDEYKYDDNRSMIQNISIMISDDEYESTTYNYDDKGNTISTEQLYKKSDLVTCHFKTTRTYNDDGYVLTSGKEILDGDCSDREEKESFKQYSYDKNGNVSSVKSSSEQGDEEAYTTLKVIESYTNEVE